METKWLKGCRGVYMRGRIDENGHECYDLKIETVGETHYFVIDKECNVKEVKDVSFK